MQFSPSVYEHAAKVIGKRPWEVSRDGDLLDPVISEIVDEVVREAYADYPEDIYAVLDKRGFGFARHDYPGYVHILGQIVSEADRRGSRPAGRRAGPGRTGDFSSHSLSSTGEKTPVHAKKPQPLGIGLGGSARRPLRWGCALFLRPRTTSPVLTEATATASPRVVRSTA